MGAGMKTLADALSHRARIFGAFEMAELENDPENRRAWLTFTVVGGGPTGVEIAGQIAELSRRSLKHEFRRFDTGEVRVLLFEGGPEILATFGNNLSRKATRELQKIGVEIHLNSIVTHIDGEGVDVKGPDGSVRHFSSRTKIWAAGVLASPLAKMLAEATGAQRDRARRIKVEPDLFVAARTPGGVLFRNRRHDELQRSARRCRGCPSVGSPCRPRHQKPRQKRCRADALEILGPRKHGRLDRRSAVPSAHGVRLSGRLAWYVWLVVHITFMTGFKNRFTALINWFLSFVGKGRLERAIVVDLNRLLTLDLKAPKVGR